MQLRPLARVARHELRNLVHKYVRNTAEGWDEMYALGYARKLEARDQRPRHYLLAGLVADHPEPRPSVLDVGCGCGTTLRYLEPRLVRYHGVDVSEEAIGACRDAFPERNRAYFEVADFARCSFGGRYDIVIFNEVLYYFRADEIPSILMKALRLLRDERSLLVISMSHSAKAAAVWARLRGLPRPSMDISVRAATPGSAWTVRAYAAFDPSIQRP